MKKVISCLITIMMVYTMIPYTVFAGTAQNAEKNINLYIAQFNPIYLDEERTVTVVEPVSLSSDARETTPNTAVPALEAETTDEATAILRAGMAARQSEVVIKLKITADEFTEEALNAKINLIYKNIFQHTGKSQEGDALKWVYKECPVEVSATGDGTNFYAIFTFKPTYYTTAEQETALTAAVEQLKSKLALDGKSDYEKVKAIYNYMTANISYDYENLNDESYTLKYTAYAALINKTSVCQGYATLFYRMACEYGIDARVVAGTSLNNKGNPERHAWNIVKLGGKYYNLDATWDSTWDADKTTHDYFLQGTENFRNHFSDDEFLAADFTSAYPISETDYVPGTVTDEDQGGSEGTEPEPPAQPEDPEPPVEPEVPEVCEHAVTEIIPAVAATCTATGLTEGRRCTGCGEVIVKQEIVPALGHTSDKTITKATTAKAGSIVETCKTCGKQLSKANISRIKAPVFKNVKFIYDAKVKKPTITVENVAGSKLKVGNDYAIQYKNQQGKVVTSPKAVGKYTAIVTFKGNYSGTVSKSFTINPKATVLNKLTKPGKKQIKVTWQKRTAQVTGYEIQYSTTKNFTKKTTKTLKVKNFKTTSKTIKNLKAKKKYWIKIRTYKTVGKNTYSSSWSKAKTIITK